MKLRLFILLILASATVSASGAAMSTNAPQQNSDSSYVIGPGDVLSVVDRSTDDTKLEGTDAKVLLDGTVVVDRAGWISIAGLTLAEVNEIVNERAKRWYVHPKFVVSLAKKRLFQVYVLGEVQHPGLYPVPPDDKERHDDATSKKPSAAFRLASALELAGGLKNSADLRHIHVTRLLPKSVFAVDLLKYILNGDVSQDLVLKAGDVIFVPKPVQSDDAKSFGASSLKVRVMGAVKLPGLVAISPDETLVSVLAKAGGLDEHAGRVAVTIARTTPSGSVESVKHDLKNLILNPNSVKVRAGDCILVSDGAHPLFRSFPQSINAGPPIGDFDVNTIRFIR